MANDVVRLRREAPRPEIGDVVGWDGEGWVPLAVFSRRGIIGPRGLGEWLKIGQSMEGPDIDLHMGNGTIGRGGDSVLVFDAGGEPVAEFERTNAGFAAALAAAGAGDLIQLPAALTLSAAHTIASGVTVRGPCVISASGAYGNLLTVVGTLEEVEIAYTAVNGGACIYNASGGCTLRRVEAVTTCTTGGTAYGALLLDLKDTTRICDCYLAAVGNYTGAVRYGLRVTTPQGSDGRKIILSNVMGYGYANSASATCYGIYVEGTQERTLLTGCMGSGWADWSDGTAVGIYAENVTMTGCIGRGAFGLVQAGIQMAHGKMFGCSGVAVPQGAGAAYGIRAGYDASVVGCRGEGRYGIYCDTGGTSCRIIGGEAVGSTTDLYVHSGTAFVYGVQYDSTDGAGTLSQAAGDRVGLDELASNANGEGASLVGIEDAGELITATDVEGALAELAADAHVAVTLSADLDANLLALAGQELDLDTQTANQVLAGPATGAAAKPAFRALVDGDIPAAIARDAEVTAEIATHAANADAHHNLVHSHAGGQEGGQLDWDAVWTDAVHDHSSNAEGGQLVDVNGAPDAVVLDADGDTSISAPVDDEIDIEVGGVDVAEWKSGGLYEAAGLDVFPDADGRGLFVRMVNRFGIAAYGDHFRSGVIPAGYAWQGAPFAGVPAMLNYSGVGDYLQSTAAGAGVRHFLSTAIANNAAAWQGKGIYGRIRTGITTEIGFRVDDGTDNNYAELYTTGALANATQRLDFRFRAGGGAINVVASGLIISCDTFVCVQLWCYWNGANYRILGYVIPEDGSLANTVNIAGFSTGIIVWPPAAGRVGILIKEAGNYGAVDWFGEDFG